MGFPMSEIRLNAEEIAYLLSCMDAMSEFATTSAGWDAMQARQAPIRAKLTEAFYA
jgi:hypothetical protein